MKTTTIKPYSSSKPLAVIISLRLFTAAFLCATNAAVRPPGPPLPDTARALWGERFDEPFAFGRTNSVETVGQFQFAESWSGYALQRSGTVVPFIIPGVDDQGHTNCTTMAGGAIRFWVRPNWLSGMGSGTFARLAELNVTGQSAALWSLQVTPDGSAISLVAQGANGPTELLNAPISWAPDLSHLICLNYTPEWTELFVDGWLVAQGQGVLPVPPVLTRLSLGSTASGAAPLEGDIDEAYTFARPLLDFDVSFHYTAYRRQISTWAAANFSTLVQASSWLAASDVMELASVPLPPGPGEGGYDTNNVPQDPGPPAYELNGMLGFLHPILTSSNLTLIITNIDQSAAYDIFYTTNLALLSAPALCATNWAWLARTSPGQTNYVFAAPLPQPECYFILGTPLDSDSDGLTDAYEHLVSHTDPLLPDSDFDGLSDYYEVLISHTDPFSPGPPPSLADRPISKCPVQ